MNKRKTKNPCDEKSEKNRHKYDYDEDEDDDDFGITITPGGSVLMPSPNPYNMSDRIKKANQQLEEEKKKAALCQRVPKVRFVDPAALDEDDMGIGEGNTKKSSHSLSESKPSKILLVTLPTAYSIESEEILTDDDYEDDLDLNTDDFRRCGSNQESSVAKFSESEEELEDSTLPLTEETLTSSLETVLCRSETEESELTESFTKSINLNTENELINSVPLDNNKSINNKELLGTEIDELVKDVIDILETNDSIEKCVSSEQLSKQLSTFENSKSNKVSVIKTLKSDFSAPKLTSKPTTVKKRNTVVDPRPSTAPSKRMCCKIGVITKLPAYNGLRSEYGLSKEQLLEREKKKYEFSKALRIEKEKKWVEERLKQKENEIKFKNWLIKKKKEAEAKTLRKLQQSNYCFRTTPAPTSHLDKIGVLRRKMLRQENTYFLLDEIFRNARPQEQKTYRIYLGLCV
ncbi:DNA ligase 1 isoform X3 [Halyomorpha halys]|uniref:DNA ligase 1 isoform X3 n=1 Tax=Halyomorpha halys TaxID=286706 RepID=UPI000D0C80D0|nr:uncharacterized protein LOC106681041 isoform X3 [Halyomorpha halys]